MKNLAALMKGLFLVFLWSLTAQASYNYTTLDYPGAVNTMPYAFDGTKIMGTYNMGSAVSHGFIYDSGNWTTLDRPETWGGTTIAGSYGDIIVGTYYDGLFSPHGFVYNGSSWTTVDHPAATYGSQWGTHVNGIYGNTVVGTYAIEYNDFDQYYDEHGFIYDGTNYITLDFPGYTDTSLNDIDGTNIVGHYFASGIDAGYKGFIFNGTNWTTLVFPGASTTIPLGIDGNNIVGYYINPNELPGTSYGFLYDGTNWTTLSYPGPSYHRTIVTDIYSDTVVGYYVDADDTGWHGFMATSVIPEPISSILFVTGGMVLAGKRYLRRKRGNT